MSYDIDLKILNERGPLKRLIADLKSVKGELDEIKKMTGGGRLGSVMSGGGGNGGGGGAGKGPFEKLADAQARLADVLKDNTSHWRKIADAEYAVAQALKKVGSAQAMMDPDIPTKPTLGDSVRSKNSNSVFADALRDFRKYQKNGDPTDPIPGDATRKRINNSAFSDAIRDFRRYQKNGDPQQKTFADKLMSTIYSTRLGVGANGQITAMPLIGQSLKLLGDLGPEFALIGTAAIATAAALKQAAETAIEFNNNMSKAIFAGGGTSAQTGALAGLGSAVGAGPTQVAGMARAFNEELKNSPFARATLGLTPNYVGAYGNTNDTGRFLDAIKKVLSSSLSDEAARKSALGTGLESFLYLRRASPIAQSQLMNSMSGGTSSASVAQSAEASANFATSGNLFMKILGQLGSMVLPPVNAVLSTINPFLELFSAGLQVVQNVLSPVTTVISGVFQIAVGFVELGIKKVGDIFNWIGGILGKALSPLKQFYDWIVGLINSVLKFLGQQLDDNKLSNAMDKTAKAAADLARALDDTRQSYGGGQNAKNALPNRYFDGARIGPYSAMAQRRAIHWGELPYGSH